jgi:hypothetical protein
LTVYTIGHSTRTIAEFVALLQQVGVDTVVDVRAFPRSRTNPQFNAESLTGSLRQAGMTYRHVRALGGRRHRNADAASAPNTLWRNEAFRNYADYAATEPFRAGRDEAHHRRLSGWRRGSRSRTSWDTIKSHPPRSRPACDDCAAARSCIRVAKQTLSRRSDLHVVRVCRRGNAQQLAGDPRGG